MSSSNKLTQETVSPRALALLIVTAVISVVLVVSWPMWMNEQDNTGSVSSVAVAEGTRYTEEQLSEIKGESYLEGKMAGIDEGIKNTSVKALFKPEIIITERQEKLCTVLGAYGETRNSSLDAAAKIIFVIINRTEPINNGGVRRSSCSALNEGKGSQFEGVKPYLKAIENIVWGDGYDYIPKSARTKGTPNAKAWNALNDLVDEIYAGKHPRLTPATHFVNLQNLKGEVKSWIRDLKPVGVSSNHFLLIDHEFINGKYVKFTKQNPYRVRSKWNQNGKK